MDNTAITQEQVDAWYIDLAKEISLKTGYYELVSLQYRLWYDAFEWTARSTRNKEIGFTGLLSQGMLNNVERAFVASVIIDHCNKAVGL